MRRFSVSKTVLLIICLMYLILYVDRVNISTAAPLIKADLGLSNTQLGLAFSAFAYPYALFQLIGGYIGDKFGARLTLCVSGLIVCAATAATGAVVGLASLFAARLALGIGEGATFPTATRALAVWVPERSWGFAQGITHVCADRQRGNAAFNRFADWDGILARRVRRACAVELDLGPCLVVVFSRRSGNSTTDCRGACDAADSQSRRCERAGALAQAVPPHAAGDRSRFLLRLDALAVPELDPIVLLPKLPAEFDAVGILLGRRFPCRCNR
jgi:hypothetical protein